MTKKKLPEGLLVDVAPDVEVLDLSHPDNAALQEAIKARGEAKKAIRKGQR